jgi:methyltransferase (TIGR00027 family)
MIKSTALLSRTARSMAAFRALESAKPVNERLFTDRYSTRFLPSFQRLLVASAKVSALRRLVERYADRRVPGARTSGIARTRLLDDWLYEDVSNGARQVVVLGAGFDCRALRLSALESIPVFEIDRPAMIGRKNRVLAREDMARRNIRRVPVDFLKESFADSLFKAGFAKEIKTLFLLEGVTNYLNAGSVAAVFDFVAGNAPAGSRIAFTYVHADAVGGRFQSAGLQPLLQSLRRGGEPWTFGFVPEALPDYLREHGLALIADLGAAEYRRRYWQTMPDRGVGYEFYRVARAEVIAYAKR